MKSPFFLLLVFYLVLSSCNSPKSADNGVNDIPKALDDNYSSTDIIYKRGNDDLLESLYKELVAKTPELNEFENQVKKLSESKSDSLRSFADFDGKNKNYYQSANNLIGQIQDTFLRERMKQLIAGSTASYETKTLGHNNLLKSIEGKTVSLNDLHLILKITRTLPVISNYQKNAFPSTKSLNGYLTQVEKVNQLADTLTKK